MNDNLFQGIPDSLPAELVSVLVERDGIRVERIVSRGHAEPAQGWFEQAEHEWVTVLAGAAILEYEGGERLKLGKGDHVLIPAGIKHRVAWTDPQTDTIWLAVFWPTQSGSGGRRQHSAVMKALL